MGGLAAAWGGGNGPVSCLSRERWNKSGRAGRERRGDIIGGESISIHASHLKLSMAQPVLHLQKKILMLLLSYLHPCNFTSIYLAIQARDLGVILSAFISHTCSISVFCRFYFQNRFRIHFLSPLLLS